VKNIVNILYLLDDVFFTHSAAQMVYPNEFKKYYINMVQ